MSISIQKANFWKRFSAWMVDSVLTVLLAMVFALATSALIKFDDHFARYNAIITEYEQNFGVTLSPEEYEQLSETDKIEYDEKKAEMQKALSQNEEAIKLSATLLTRILVIIGVSLFLSVLTAHYIIPLCLRDGKTLGKKTFGLAVVRSNGVKITAPILFVRALVGLLAMETLAVLLLCTMGIVGIIAALGVQLLQIFVLIKTPNNSAIHDLLADTVVVDFASQRIFKSQDEFLEAVKTEHAESAAETPSI